MQGRGATEWRHNTISECILEASTVNLHDKVTAEDAKWARVCQQTSLVPQLGGNTAVVGEWYATNQTSLVLSLMKQRIAKLKGAHLEDANDMIYGLRKLKPEIFRKVTNLTDVYLCSFSDSAHPIGRESGQTGFFIGICQEMALKTGVFSTWWTGRHINSSDWLTRHMELK